MEPGAVVYDYMDTFFCCMVEKASEKTSISDRTIEKDIAHLKEIGILSRESGRKEGKWIIKTGE